MTEGPKGGGKSIAQDCKPAYRLEACDILGTDSIVLEDLDLLLDEIRRGLVAASCEIFF